MRSVVVVVAVYFPVTMKSRDGTMSLEMMFTLHSAFSLSVRRKSLKEGTRRYVVTCDIVNVVRRLLARAQSSGRDDDNIESIRKRCSSVKSLPH